MDWVSTSKRASTRSIDDSKNDVLVVISVVVLIGMVVAMC